MTTATPIPTAARNLLPPSFRAGEIRAYLHLNGYAGACNKSFLVEKELIKAAARKLNLPLRDEDVLTEEPGHGRGEWWSSAVGGRRTRPELTRLMRDVWDGKTRCILVPSLMHLTTDGTVFQAMADVFDRHGVLVVDASECMIPGILSAMLLLEDPDGGSSAFLKQHGGAVNNAEVSHV